MPKIRHENSPYPTEELPALAIRDGTTGTGVGKDKATGPKARQIVPPPGAASWLILKAMKYQPFWT
jgi:hypothetical protein